MADAGSTGTNTGGFTVSVSDVSELSGLTAQVSSDGEPLNLRAEPSSDGAVVATLADGTIVDLRIDVLDTVHDASGVRWWPVAANGHTGWVSGFYLVEPGTSASSTNVTVFKNVPTESAATTQSSSTDAFSWDGGSLTNATALVSANGDGLNLRAAPGRDGEVIASIPDGTIVDLRIDMTDTVRDPDGVTRWWPVLFDGQTGWVAGTYLVSADAGTESKPESERTSGSQFSFDGGTLADATAVVTTDGDNLLLRAEPSSSSGILDRIPDGTVVDLRIDTVDTVYDPDGVTRWWPVSHDGQDGWVSGFFLSDGTDTASPGSDGTSGSTDPSSEARDAFTWDGTELDGATAVVSANGDGANVRSEPAGSSDVVATVQDGTVVNLRIAEVDTVVGADGVTRWWPVEVDGTDGWISGFFLRDASTSTDRSSTTSDSQSSSTDTSSQRSSVFVSGSTVMVQTESGGGLRVRQAAGTDSQQIGSIAEGSTVTVVGGPASFENSVNGWFEVTGGGTTGFVDGDLLVLVATPEPTPVPDTPTPSPVPTEAPPTRQQPQGTDTESPLDDQPTPVPTQTPDARPTEEPTEAPEPTDEPSGAQFIVPVAGATLTQNFGCSSLGFYPYNPDWGCGVHDGIDYAAPAYTPIVASGSGTVVTAGWCDCGLGYYVEIDHGNGVHTIYGHMASQPYVSVGQQVSQGETIGPVGSTGLSTGPHVHFMVQVNGVSQDPARYLG